jgi:hypothetical protein
MFSGCPFTGKERDVETGNDYFGPHSRGQKSSKIVL